MSVFVKKLRAANTWLNEGDCCGQLDASGTCMAPACIFGEALRMANEAAARIEQLEAEVKSRTLEYLGQVGQLSDEIERLRTALRPFADVLRGNWSHQQDEMVLDVGFGPTDLRLKLRLGDFRIARAALEDK